MIAVIVAVFMIIAFSVCFLDEKILVTSQSSPDGNYTVYLYQVGSPQWSFGPVDAELVLKNSNGKTADKVKFSLANDGAGVFEGNIEEITWLEDQVEIIMGESDTTQRYTYILSYTK